tara:strand:+ start:2613 stop:2921 length:309 start_codon:yes stop_codon:yes gene_type:complete
MNLSAWCIAKAHCRRAAIPRNRRIPYLPVQLSRHPEATERLAEVGLCGALLLGCQGGSSLCEVGVCCLDEGLHRCNDTRSSLALQGLGLEGLDDEGEDLGGL